jgi:hypothetical protein
MLLKPWSSPGTYLKICHIYFKLNYFNIMPEFVSYLLISNLRDIWQIEMEYFHSSKQQQAKVVHCTDTWNANCLGHRQHREDIGHNLQELLLIHNLQELLLICCFNGGNCIPNQKLDLYTLLRGKNLLSFL